MEEVARAKPKQLGMKLFQIHTFASRVMDVQVWAMLLMV